MNTTIQNPVAAVASITYVPATTNRPVTYADIAAKLGMSPNTVCTYMNPKYPSTGKGVQLVRKTAEEMGYDPKAVKGYFVSHGRSWKTKRIDFTKVPQTIDGPVTQTKIAEIAGTSVGSVCRALAGGESVFFDDIRKLASMYGYENPKDPAVIEKRKAEKKAKEYYRGTPFHSAEERKEYMLRLREQGYGNFEIARKAGTVPRTVRSWIGKEPAELAKHNRTMAAKFRAQKNAARKVYLHNQKVADFNAKAEQHNAIKAEAERLMAQAKKMEAALKPEEQKIAAMAMPAVPLVNLTTVQPTQLN